jgi:hypothetical protein
MATVRKRTIGSHGKYALSRATRWKLLASMLEKAEWRGRSGERSVGDDKFTA